MNLNRIQKELKKFDKYKFYPEPHIYTYIDNNCKEVEISTSVTSLIEEYTQEFDKEKVAEIKAKKEGTTKEEILDKWKYNNDFACNNNDFKLYECANLDDKAKKLLELRKVEV